MVEKILLGVVQNIPTALVLGAIYLFSIQPVNSRLDKVFDVMNREIIPVVNELKRQPLPGPDIKPLADSLEQQRAEIKKRFDTLQAAIEENKRVALGAAVSPALAAFPQKTFKQGEVLDWSYWKSPSGPERATSFIVTDAQNLNSVKSELLRSLGQIGLKPTGGAPSEKKGNTPQLVPMPMPGPSREPGGSLQPAR